MNRAVSHHNTAPQLSNPASQLSHCIVSRWLLLSTVHHLPSLHLQHLMKHVTARKRWTTLQQKGPQSHTITTTALKTASARPRHKHNPFLQCARVRNTRQRFFAQQRGRVAAIELRGWQTLQPNNQMIIEKSALCNVPAPAEAHSRAESSAAARPL